MPTFYNQILNYRSESFAKLQAHYESLASGQSPHTLLLTCADSRLCPQEISQSQAGEIFVIRNAGNFMPPYKQSVPSNEGLTLEYGIEALNIPEIVVCGHASCGAMAGLMNVDQLEDLPIVQSALKNYREHHSDSIQGKTLNQLIAWNVENQLRSVFSYPFIQKRLQTGKLKVFGMVYDFVSAEVTYQAELNANGEVSS